jgi:hypothetical protein
MNWRKFHFLFILISPSSMSDGDTRTAERRSSLIDSQFPVESRPLAGPSSTPRFLLLCGILSDWRREWRERAMEHILSEWR